MSSDKMMLFERMLPEQGNLLVESSHDQKDWYMKGIFMTSEKKNRNGRIYTLGEMTEQVDEAMKMIKQTNGLLGELDHPENRLGTALANVSHVITELRMDGNNVRGVAKIINTPSGIIAREILKAGVILGVSSRGTGAVNESNGRVNGFKLNTIDIVTTPSAHDAYPQGIYESLQENAQGKHVISLAEAVIHDEAAQKYLSAEIIRFLSHINATKSK